MNAYRCRFQVGYDIPVYRHQGTFRPGDRLLEEILAGAPGRKSRVLVYVDRTVADRHPGLEQRLTAWFAKRSERLTLAAPPTVISGG